MRLARVMVALLAAIACVLGVTESVVGTPAGPTSPIDRVALPDSAPADLTIATRGPQASVGRSRQPAEKPDDVPATTPTPAAPDHPCRPAEHSPTPTVQPSPTPAAQPSPTSAGMVPAAQSTPVSNGSTCGPDGTAGIRPVASRTCTVNATSTSQVNSARAGDTVCFSGNALAGTPLNITASGTENAPIVVTGDGKTTTVKGIRVTASNVIVQGFNVIGAAAPGVQLKGNNLTLQDTTIDHPTGGDYDGIRYFGDEIKILHNQISNITNTHGAHADCMQTFATTTPTSHNVLIDGNRCDKIDNQCLIAQGPHSKAGNGSGKGESSGLVFSNNYCDAHASQAVHIDDVQNVTMMSNDIEGKVQKAFNFINKSTGAKVSCNKLGPGVGKSS